MNLENMVAEGKLIWESFMLSLKTTKWYVYLAKFGHLVLFIVGLSIAAHLSNYLLGWIVLSITIAYVIFYALWIKKRIDKSL